MNIVPISSMSVLDNSPLRTQSAQQQTQLPFQNVLRQAISNLEETSAIKEQDSLDLAVGEVDNLAEIMINSEKADIALQMAVNIRNRLLDAYSEITRMNV